MENSFDVIVIGLGPTGATLAGLLGQRGLSVAVFDRLPDIYPLPRAIGLDHEAMRIVQELGLADAMKPHIADYRPSEYRGMDGELIKRLDTLPEPHRLSWQPNYVFDQPAFEKVLRKRLTDYSNVKVFLQADITDSGQDADHAWVDAKLANESEITRCTAQYIVACDGASSPTRKRLGIALEDLNFDEHWLVVDVIVSDEKLQELPQTQVQYCEAQRPSTFVVGPGNHRRWEIMLLEGDSLSPDFPDNELWPLLSRWIKPGEGRLWRAAAYRFHGLIANSWRCDRIFLAGDAAHMTPPFMAQGMVAGMRDAHNLAWKLARVIRKKSPDSLLDSYVAERYPHVRQLILKAMELGRIICERDNTKAIERDARLRQAHNGVIKTEYRQNMIPNLAHGLIATETTFAGELFPQPFVQSGAFHGRLDDLIQSKICVVVSGTMADADIQAYIKLLEPLDGLLIHLEQGVCSDLHLAVTEDHSLIHTWLASQQKRVAVVRPDKYVYGTADTHSGAFDLLLKFQQQLGIDSAIRTNRVV